MESLLNKIESSINYVGANSKNVKINYQKIDELLQIQDFSSTKYWLDTNPFNILDMDLSDIIFFLFIYHTIGDYCFWGNPKWEINTENGKLDGSYAMLYLIAKNFSAFKKMEMSYAEFATLFKANVSLPLIENRYSNLKVLYEFLTNSNENIYVLIKDMHSDTELFAFIVKNLNYFQDEALYQGRKVYFYKRAQLLTSDILHVREKIEQIKVDYFNLVGCADYKIPQVMHSLGLLEYSEALSEIIENQEQLPEESEMEVEIRASDLLVINYIKEKLNNKISRMDINDYIWLLGQDKTKKMKPYHRTLTSHY